MDTGDGSLLPPALSLPLTSGATPAVPLSGGMLGSMPQATMHLDAKPLMNGVSSGAANGAPANGFLPQTMPMPAMGTLPGGLAAVSAVPAAMAAQMPQIPISSAPSEATSARGTHVHAHRALLVRSAVMPPASHALLSAQQTIWWCTWYLLTLS